ATDCRALPMSAASFLVMTVTDSFGTRVYYANHHMTRDALLDLFHRSGALHDGHFRLSSGLHSPGYLQCALVLQHPQHAEALGRAMADRTRDLRPTLVVSPALGGVVIGHEAGRALGIRAIFAERFDGALTLRRGLTAAES